VILEASKHGLDMKNFRIADVWWNSRYSIFLKFNHTQKTQNTIRDLTTKHVDSAVKNLDIQRQKIGRPPNMLIQRKKYIR